MAWWKRNKDNSVEENSPSAVPEPKEQQPEDIQSAETLKPEELETDVSHDAVSGTVGPFDGDNVNIEDFDFSDFSAAVLDLHSMKIPMPKESQVQVEMGPEGPRLIHIVTKSGRMTPVAFAAATSEKMWRKSTVDIREGMVEQGLQPRVETGPWGREIVANQEGGEIRIIGVDGPRWLLRFTLAGPNEHAEELAELAREIMARTFVYRGSDPILAGNALPAVLPEQLSKQVHEEIQRRAQQMQQQNNNQADND